MQQTECHPSQMSQDLRYWQQQLSGAPPLLELPTDRARPAQQKPTRASQTITLSAPLATRLRESSLEWDVSLHAILLATFSVLLSRYSAKDDLVVGSSAIGAKEPSQEHALDVLAMRMDLSGTPSFREYLTQVQANLIAANQHRALTFEALVEEISLAHSNSYAPLFQVLFQMQDQETSELADAHGHISGQWNNKQQENLDLVLNMVDTDKSLRGELTYNTDLFDDATITRLTGHIETLLEGVVDAAETPIAKLPLLTSAERHQVLQEWNDTARDYALDRCVHHLFEDQVQRSPEAPAVLFESEELNYADFNARSNQLAHYLIKQGVGRDVCVGVCMDRSMEMVISLYAILKAGGAFVPLDPDYPAERLGYMLEDAQVPVLLAQQHLATTFPDYSGALFCVDSEWDKVCIESTENPQVQIDPTQLAYIVFTSGSTGRPKGAMNSHRGLCSRLLFMQERYPITAADALLQKTPFSFDPCVWEIFWPLFIGAKLVVPRPQGHKDPDYLVQMIIQHGVSVMEFVPSMLQVFLETRHASDCVSLRHVFSSGEVLPVELQRQFFACFSEVNLYNTYGPSEAAIDTSYWVCERDSVDATVPIGRPIANTQLYVLDKHLQPQPIGVPGELHIGGVQVGQGYVNRPDLTEAVFIDDPFNSDPHAKLYKTGDLTQLRPDGAIDFLGRIDTQVKLRGFRIELAEIETVVMTHPAVSEAVVVVNGEGVEQQLTVYFVCSTAIDAEQLRQHIADRLPEYMVPALYMALEAIPQLPNGKVDRRSLPQPDRRQLLSSDYRAPETQTEKALADIWSNLLEVEQVGLHDDFFALGGHSLKAVQVVSRARNQLSLEIPFNWLFEIPTIGQIAARLDANSAEIQAKPTLPLVPIGRDDRLALSFAQERLWFVDQLEGASELYNIPFGLRLLGQLNIDVLEWALQEIVRRHEVLRSKIILNEKGEPEQKITNASLVLGRETVRGSAEQCSAELSDWARQEANTVFSLSDDIKIRALLVAVHVDNTEPYHTLFITPHHIASDGWSEFIFGQELGALYLDGCEGVESSLPQLPVQYADYAAWQRAWLDDARLGEQLTYWQQQLASVPPLLEVPTDRPRPAQQEFNGDTLGFKVPAALTKQLRLLGGERGATLYMTMLCAFKVLLARYSGEQDIVVGSPIANRQQEEIESLIGFFVNTLVLRSEIASESTFDELLDQVRETTLAAYQHQDVPFEKLVETLQPTRSLSYSPLFQVMFQFQNIPEFDLEMHGLNIEWLDLSEAAARFDLTMTLAESGDEIKGWLNYNTDLFDASTIERMAGHFAVLLESIVGNPQLPVAQLGLLSDSERQALLSKATKTTTVYPDTKTVVDLFTEQAKISPTAPAVEGQQGRALDYASLDQASNRFAHYLLSQGAAEQGSSKRIGVYLERDVDMLIALLGVLKAGAAYVPLDPLFPPDRLALMAEDAQLSTIVTQTSLHDSVPGTPVNTILIDTLGGALASCSDAAIAQAQVDDIAYVIYTSGSTGRPKGVSIGHQALTNFLCSMQKEPGLSASDRLLAVTTLSFDIAGLELYLPLISGACTVLASREESMDPQQLAARLVTCQATVMQATPATWRMLLDSGWQGMPALKVLCGGEAMPWELATELLASCGELWNLYGPTETTIWSTLSRIELDAGRVSVGKPIANTQVYVLDAAQALQPVGVTGELYIGGDGVAEGYLDRAELTAERFIPDPFKPGARLYRTGDRARWQANGNLDVLGRLDEQVKLRGYRIEPGEIRARLVESENIADAVVIVREDVPGEAQLVAYLVGAEGASDVSESVTQLRTQLQATLPDYMVPTAWVSLDALPLTPNGKVNRRALPEPAYSPLASAEYVAPETATEVALADIWSTLLGVERVGIYDDFFSLGGHSLKAVQMISRTRNKLAVEIPLKWLFEAPTVNSLSSRIDTEKSAVQAADQTHPLQRVDRNQPLAMTFAQEGLWFLDQMNGSSALYNITFGLNLKGHLNREFLTQALESVVARHEALRTRIENGERGAPTPYITDTRLVVSHDEISGTEESCQIVVDNLAQEELATVFDLSADLKIRARLIRITAEASADYHVLLITMHHIASDGWSLDVFARELAEFYTAACENRAASLVDLPVQFTDYVAWQRSWLDESRMAKQLSYWQQQLAGAPPLLELPTDRPRPAERGFNGQTHKFTIPAKLTHDLLSAFNVLLSRYSGEQDIVVGSPIANRQQEEIESLIGFFVNTLVMRSDLSGDITFNQLLERVRDTTLSAYEHQDVPFEKLVEELQPERSMSYSPFFQVMFQLQNMPNSKLAMPGLDIEWIDDTEQTAKFDLTLGLYESGEQLNAWFNYNTDLFDNQTIERMAMHFETLLESVVARPTTQISKLDLLSKSARQELLVQWNDTAEEYANATNQQCAHEVFESQAAELNERANQLAHYLIQQGVSENHLVGICLQRSIEMYVGILATLKTGGAYVPIDPAYPADRICLMIDDSTPDVVLTHSSARSKLPATDSLVVELDAPWPALKQADEVDYDLPATNPDVKGLTTSSMAYVIYTSGSSGRPKGVQGTHGGILNRCQWMWQAYPFADSEVNCLKTAISFVDSVWEMFGPLLQGVPALILADDEVRDPEQFVSLLANKHVSRLVVVPSLLTLLLDRLESSGEKLPALKICSASGETLPADTARRFYQLLPDTQLLNLYGSSEVAADVTYYEVPADIQSTLVPIGRPIANSQVYILDRHMQPVPVGVGGELYIGGANVALGYYKQPAMSAERFLPSPFSDDPKARLFKTGDLACWRAEGQIDYLGRNDSQVKIRGFRIELGEVESVLGEHESISDVVVAMTGEGDARQLVAYFVATESLSLDDLREHLAKRLPDYMIPSQYVQLEALPLTPNGKVDRLSLPSTDAAIQLTSANAYVAPKTETEKALAEIWADMLNVEQVGMQDDFLSMGGHSLLAVRLVGEMDAKLGIKVPLIDLFQGATIEDVVASQSTQQQAHADHKICRLITKPGRYRPLFMAGTNPRYSVVAKQFDSEQPAYQLDAYALQANQLKNGRKVYKTIEEIASAFIKEIREVQPVGPYNISGGCEGSLIAFEIAAQLLEQGESVAQLINWGTAAPGKDLQEAFEGSSLKRLWWQFQTIRSKGSLRELGFRAYRELFRHEYVEYTLFSSMLRYKPTGKIDADLHIMAIDPMEGEEQDADLTLGWRKYLSGEVIVKKLPGNHDTWLQKHAHVFGDYLESRLEETRMADL